MKAVCRSDKGIVRSTNQDWVEIRNFDDLSCLVVVCDGIGGVAGGEIASKTAAEEICTFFEKNLNKDIKNIIIESIKKANEKILEIGRSSSSFHDLGTTSVVVFARNDALHVANVGDSRAYIISEDEISQITNDHSIINELLMQGKITSEEAENAPNKNIITRALGCANSTPDYYNLKIEKNQKILVCTDGLTNCITNEEIHTIVSRENDSLVACEKLIFKANKNGGIDNITVSIIS